MRIGGTDKLLIGIVVGVILLVAVAFAAVLLQPKPTYQIEETAEGVVHNYMLALSQFEYARAYPLLAQSLPGRPKTLDAFERQVQNHPYTFNREPDAAAWQVESAKVNGDTATVQVRVTRFYSGSLFQTTQAVFTPLYTLEREAGAWRIVRGRESADWLDCWRSTEGCD